MDLYTIESEDLRLSVSPMGADMRSLIRRETGEPLLWEGRRPTSCASPSGTRRIR